MDRRSWAVQIGWKHHLVESDFGEGTGSIRLNGVLMERWTLNDSTECHRLIVIRDQRLGLHLFKDHTGKCNCDLSLNGISIETGEKVEAFLPTPSGGIWKQWCLRLESGLHILCLDHCLHIRRTVYIDGKLMLDIRCEVEEEGDHLFMFKGCQIGIHLRQMEKEGFLYHVTVDGTPQDPGGLPGDYVEGQVEYGRDACSF
ncbi:hypothetical protein ACFQ49_10730 [Kroppenstedtia eburnea]|uniref:Fas apoptotic inhibitory molecule (FAIM1) n=1 Tax=Kroppenstedtia eburnea TaxID=714067 RepID=A0A1N7NB28_9BACL|nr:hypothetical protein [Kroppenstedtia eburnea]EGK11840.1 hypothetical protein HMPREF9374_1846 [Desmospora sp. 8437]QKI83107.1 hypothetical protein GXN75_14475 [Kroppenstedtia eburnea]SIS95421.1 Fas apoptotic inhibitory molecule (FAIM1) [Kroppenstedtia eburnea]